jgi:hypothetical protein
MKTINIDTFLNDNAVEVIINQKPFIVRDMTMELAQELGKEDSDKKAILSKIIGCDIKDFDAYGAIAIFGIVQFLNENLLPKVSQ